MSKVESPANIIAFVVDTLNQIGISWLLFVNNHMMTNFDWNAFFTNGFLFQVDPTRFYIGHGPFEPVTIDHRKWFNGQFSHDFMSKGLLIKPNFWDFLSDQNPSAIPALRPESTRLVSRDQLFEALLKNVPSRSVKQSSQNDLLTELVWNAASFADFQSQFEFLQKLMQQKKLQKGVPIVSCEARCEMGPSVFALLSSVLTKMQSDRTSWAYGFWESQNGKSVGFVGYTPEILFSYNSEKEEVKLMALAGTWSKKDSNANFSDAKIWDEHNIVIEDILERLSKPNRIQRLDSQVIELKDLWHLKTELLVQGIELTELLEFVSRLHPTAALGIYPRNLEIARQFSQQKNQKDRGTFGAPFIFLHPDHCSGLVSIRRVDWSGSSLKVLAGCGVLQDSNLEAEFAEIQAKQHAVMRIFDLEPAQ